MRIFTQLFSAAKCLASRYRPVGKRLAIVTNGGGPGVLAADWASKIGLKVVTLSEATSAELSAQLPDSANLGSVIDLGEAALPEHYNAALLACGAATAQPVSGAPADRAIPHRPDAGRVARHTGRRRGGHQATQAARVREGL